jgi:hypothetical protein
MSVLRWIQKGKRALEWMERLWEERRDPLDEDATVLLSEEQLGYIEERAQDASVSARHDLRMLVLAVRRQNEKVMRAVDLLAGALRLDDTNADLFEEQVADALHALRSVAPNRPLQNNAVARLLRVMGQPLDDYFTEGELVDVFMAPTNPLEGVAERPTLMQAFAALLTMNYGSEDTSANVGKHEVGGPYGRYGLTEEESRALAALQGFIGGWLRAFGAEPKRVYEAVGEEVKRVGLLRASWSERLGAGEAIGDVLPQQSQATLVSVPPMKLLTGAEDAQAVQGHLGITLGATKDGITEIFVAREPVAIRREPVAGTVHVNGEKVADITSIEIDDTRGADDCITKLDE